MVSRNLVRANENDAFKMTALECKTLTTSESTRQLIFFSSFFLLCVLQRPTPQVAADMLHLSLWQPNYWKNACLESGHLLPTQDHITNWLLQVSMAMMIDSDEVTPREAVLWLNGAECRLCETWLSRVEDSPLMNATLYLHGIQPVKN